MSEEKKNNFFNKMWDIIGMDGLFFETGKHTALLVGSLIVIERMIGFYINFPIEVKNNFIFNIGYMFAIFSIPLWLSAYYLKIILGEENE